MSYEVWILGLIETENKDYERLMGTFPDKKAAIWFVENYPFDYVEDAHIVVEQVEYDEDGSGSCVDVILESEL